MTDSNNLSRRRFLQATGGAASAVALAGCTGDSDQDTTTTPGDTTSGTTDETTDETTRDTPDEQQRTYEVVGSTVTTLDPIEATDTASGGIIQNVFSCLTNYPNGHTTPEPLLAEDWEISDDGTELTFNLRQGVTYSNGDEVTAQDFVYSWERLAASDSSARAGFLLDTVGVEHETDGDGNYVPDSKAVEAPDDYTLNVTLSGPFHMTLEMLAYTSFSAIPEGHIGDIDGYEGEVSQDDFANGNQLIGSGPFTLENWEKKSEWTLEARPMDEYFREGPYIEAKHARILSQPNPQYEYSVTNVNADHPVVIASQYNGDNITIEGEEGPYRYGTYGPLANDLTAEYYEYSQLGSYYFGFNCNSVDKPARKAFTHAFSHDEYADLISVRPVRKAYMMTPPAIFPGGGQSAYEEFAQDYPYGQTAQLDRARQVMEDAGYSEDNPYEMTFSIYTGETPQRLGQSMRDKLANCHVDMSFEQIPFSTLVTQAENGNVDTYYLGWIADYPAPDNFLQLINPQSTQITNPSALSYFNWGNEDGGGTQAAQRATDAWETVQNNTAPNEEAKQTRNEAYKTMEKAMWEDVPCLMLDHDYTQAMRYPWVNIPERTGTLGGSRSKENDIIIEDRSQYMN